ncbi:MAG: ABC transporter permease [Rikenellaceae bacterium]|nr:ABC transporter permease [Rikenellaceae bacterium]
MFDFIQEILSTIRKNKMRTFLTGFAVAWGIFILMVLLAAGNGLRNGVMSNFEGMSLNSVDVWPGRTSKPYGGYRSGRRIRFDHRDVEMLQKYLPHLDGISPFTSTNATVTYEKDYVSGELWGVSQDEKRIYNIEIVENGGRFINEIDVLLRRKVIVLSSYQRLELFEQDVDPIGKYVVANRIAFKVIGIYDNENPNSQAYIPYTLGQLLFSRGGRINGIEMLVSGLETQQANDEFNLYLRELLARHHGFDPQDRNAVHINNRAEQALQMNVLFGMVHLFVLIIGVACLMAGIVGVGNIMLITVKERTREIGIRKAIGATPASILKLIILEAIFITTCAGYLGVLSEVLVTELLATKVFNNGSSEQGMNMFLDPTVDLGTVLGATLFLIGCGVIAGLVPALRATRVSPIEAMRAE